MAKEAPEDQLDWKSIEVRGRRINYGVAGEGLPVLFIHGWALGQHAYKRPLQRLVRRGCRVYAPALPGFGGSEALPHHECDIAGYAAWADAFLDAIGVDEPVFVIGHSFGGGVAAKLAHDFPGRLAHLVLINSVGGGAWLLADNTVRSLAERPIWEWAVRFSSELLLARGVVGTLRAVLEDAVPNLARNPWALYRVGMLARRADLTAELATIRARGLPVLLLWGEGDTIIPRASFDALCAAAGCSGVMVPGRHSWLLADPDRFGEVLADQVAIARAARDPASGAAGQEVEFVPRGARRPDRAAAR